MTNATLPRLSELRAQHEQLNALQACFAVLLTTHLLGPIVFHHSDRDGIPLETKAADFLNNRGFNQHVQRLVTKAAVSAGATSDPAWSPLAPTRPMIEAYIAAVDRRSVLSQLGAVEVPSTNAVSATQTVTATATWLGEQSAKPLSALGFAAMSLPPRKLAADVAVSAELVRVASANVVSLVQRAVVVSAVASALDLALLDPANAGSAFKPAALSNGVTPLTPTGDFQNQIGQVFAGISGGAPTRPTLIVSLQTALRLQGIRDLEAIGVNVLVTPAAGNRLIAVDSDAVAFTDDGGRLEIGEPDIQMDSAPDTPSTASTVLVSTFQRNLKVIRGERWVNWTKRSDAVPI